VEDEEDGTPRLLAELHPNDARRSKEKWRLVGPVATWMSAGRLIIAARVERS
jgi:hypothetical protein